MIQEKSYAVPTFVPRLAGRNVGVVFVGVGGVTVGDLAAVVAAVNLRRLLAGRPVVIKAAF